MEALETGCSGKLPQGRLSAETSRTKDLSFRRPCYNVNSDWVWAGQEEFQLPPCMLLLAPHTLILHGNPELSAPCSSLHFGQGLWSTERVLQVCKKSNISTMLAAHNLYRAFCRLGLRAAAWVGLAGRFPHWTATSQGMEPCQGKWLDTC